MGWSPAGPGARRGFPATPRFSGQTSPHRQPVGPSEDATAEFDRSTALRRPARDPVPAQDWGTRGLRPTPRPPDRSARRGAFDGPPWPGEQPGPLGVAAGPPPRGACPERASPGWQRPPSPAVQPAGRRAADGHGFAHAQGSAANWNYVDNIRSSELVPTRRIPPGRGWRKAVYLGSFKLINLGQSPDERYQGELDTKIRSLLRGQYKIGVLGKGGVGKSTIAASVGSVFAELRQDDRVVAIDADTGFGKLASRIDPSASGSYWELAADSDLYTFSDIRHRVGSNKSGLFVLPGEAATARRRILDADIYRKATTKLDRHFTLSIIDCGSTLDSPVTREVLDDLDALIVVSSPWYRRRLGGRTDPGMAGQRRLHRAAASHRGGRQRLRRARRQARSCATGGTLRWARPEGDRDALRRAPAPGRGDRRAGRAGPADPAPFDGSGRGLRRAFRGHRGPSPGGVMTATADKSVSAGAETMVPASSRVSLLVGESHQIDLLLPAAVALNKLAEPTRDAINQRLRSIGAEELPARGVCVRPGGGDDDAGRQPVAGSTGGQRRGSAGVRAGGLGAAL